MRLKASTYEEDIVSGLLLKASTYFKIMRGRTSTTTMLNIRSRASHTRAARAHTASGSSLHKGTSAYGWRTQTMGPREDVCEHTHRIECAHTHECVNTHRPDERLFSSAVGRRPGRNRPGRNPTEREGSTPNPSRPSSPWKARNASSLFLGASRRKVKPAHHIPLDWGEDFSVLANYSERVRLGRSDSARGSTWEGRRE